MQLCQRDNETYALNSYEIDRFFMVKGNRITGWLGQAFDDLLIKPSKRKCEIIAEMEIGTKNKNGSFDGILGLLQSNKAQLMLRGEPPFYKEDFLSLSTSFHTERFLILQDITEDIKKSKFYDLLDSFIFEKKIVLAGLLTSLMMIIVFIGIQFLKEKETLKKIYNARSIARFRSFLLKKIYLIGYSDNQKSRNLIGNYFFFLFIFQFAAYSFIYRNNIKDDKIVVDSSGVVKNIDDLFKTDRTHCFIENETEHRIAKLYLNIPNTTNVMTRLLVEKTNLKKSIKGLNNKRIKDKCIVEKLVDNLNFQTSGNSSVFGVVEMVYILLRSLSEIKSKNIAWLSLQQHVYELNYHYYYRKDPKNTRYYNKLVINYLEMGDFIKFYNTIRRIGFDDYLKSNILFTNLNQYKKGLIKFDALKFENFENLFGIYSFICLILIISSITRKMRKKLTNKFSYRYGYLIRRLLNKRRRKKIKKRIKIRIYFIKPKICYVKPKIYYIKSKSRIKKIKNINRIKNL